MLNLLELEQFVAFADLGTLSKVAEELHISQPTITRTMKHVEAAFGVPLFVRSKNKIELNETGQKAAEHSRSLLDAAQNTVQQVRAYHTKLHTITVEACAPAPLWSLLPLVSSYFPEKAVSSKLSELSAIQEDVELSSCELGILPYPASGDNLICIPIIQENLFVCIPRNHELAEKKSMTFADLNGFNCLLHAQIGFWSELCRRKMPASKFLVQTEAFALEELIRTSTLPCFTTNLADYVPDILSGRNRIPITDTEANVTYHLIFRKDNARYTAIAKQLRGETNYFMERRK